MPAQTKSNLVSTTRWDVGSGVVDDAAGFFIAWEALRAISKITPVPRRTIRAVGWVNEEMGGAGAKVYAENHLDELDKHIFALESDIGVFQPWGIAVKGSEKAVSTLTQIGESFLSVLGSGNVTTSSKWRDHPFEIVTG
jgi:carboxypeptidase Q